MHSRRRLVTVAVLACMTLTGLAGATPASAAPVPDPCKVLKVGQISKVFGSAVDAGVRAAREISSSSCSYSVPAGTDTPAGELIVTVTFSNAKTTYASLRRDQRFSPLTQDGFKGLYAPSPLGVVQVLRKSTMLSIQGVFFDAATYADVEVKEQLVALAKLGTKRV